MDGYSVEWRISTVRYYLIGRGELRETEMTETDRMGIAPDMSAITESDWQAMCDGNEAALIEDLEVVDVRGEYA